MVVIKNDLGVEPLELGHMKQLAMHHQVTQLHSMGRTLLKLNYFHQRFVYLKEPKSSQQQDYEILQG